MKEKLWTKDYTIITVGSAVSMIGNALAGFAICLLVLDNTDSTMLFSVFVGAFTFPQIVTPVFSGALLDRFSRKKTIYTLDFISSALYLLSAVVIARGHFSYTYLAVMCFIIGTINSIYTIAFQSFYPLLVSPENYSKAYSVQSLLETLVTVVIPVSAVLYGIIGIVPILAIDAACFFTAACIETRVTAQETHMSRMQSERSRENLQMMSDVVDGLKYLRSNTGLLLISVYFFFDAMGDGAISVVLLPYFTSNFEDGEYVFIAVGAMMVLSRVLMGIYLYRHKFKKERKIYIASFAYVVSGLMYGSMLFMPLPVMMIMAFIVGLVNFSSGNIRISGTQRYVPDENKGRFNGAFAMINKTGVFVGEMISGVLGELVSPRFALAAMMAVAATASTVLIYGGRKHVAPVYNVD